MRESSAGCNVFGMMQIQGTAGEIGADGWVEWTTSDAAQQHRPTLSCGSFYMVLVLEGSDFALTSARLLVARFAGDDPEEDGDSSLPYEAMDFAWSLLALVGAAVSAAFQMEHPAPQNVANAARQLFAAIAEARA